MFAIFQGELQARTSLKAFFLQTIEQLNYFSERFLSSRGPENALRLFQFFTNLLGQINCLKSYKCAKNDGINTKPQKKTLTAI